MPRRWVRVRSLYCFSITTARANWAGVTSRLMTDSLELSYSRITARMSFGGNCSSTTISAASPSASASSTSADSAPTMSPAAISVCVFSIRARWFVTVSPCDQSPARPSSHRRPPCASCASLSPSPSASSSCRSSSAVFDVVFGIRISPIGLSRQVQATAWPPCIPARQQPSKTIRRPALSGRQLQAAAPTAQGEPHPPGSSIRETHRLPG